MRTISLKAIAAAQDKPSGDVVPHDQILLLPDVKAITKLSTPTIYRDMAAGRFPRSLKISRGRVGWRASEINLWLSGLSRSEAGGSAALGSESDRQNGGGSTRA